MRRKNRSYVNVSKSKKDKTYKGVLYKSRLERQMAKMLDEANLPLLYEKKTFNIFKSCSNSIGAIRKTVKNTGEYKMRDTKLSSVKYTPDFIDEDLSKDNAFIIETKGRPDAVFMLRFKIFQRYCNKYYPNLKIYMPRNMQQCKETIKLILKDRENDKQN